MANSETPENYEKKAEEFKTRVEREMQELVDYGEQLKLDPEKSLTVAFNAKLKGEVLYIFMHLRKMVVNLGLATSSTFAAEVIEAGLRTVYDREIMAYKMALAMSETFTKDLPDNLKQSLSVEATRSLVKMLKQKEEEAAKESLSDLHEGTNKGS